MLSFKDITDYYDLSENEATFLRFIINNASADPGLNTPENNQPSSTITNKAQTALEKLQRGNATLN